MTRYALAAAAAVALAAATPAAAQQPAPPKTDPMTDALAIAQALVPGGVLVKGRNETSKAGAPIFGFYFWVDGKLREIEITPSGMVHKDTNKTPDPVSEDVAALITAKGRQRVKLPDGRLAEIAAGALNGTPISSITYFRRGDRLLVRFGTVTLDSETGQVVPPPK